MTKDVNAVAEIMRQQLEETHKEVDEILVRKQLEEMRPAISLSYIAKTYFKKSRVSNALLHLMSFDGSPVEGPYFEAVSTVREPPAGESA